MAHVIPSLNASNLRLAHPAARLAAAALTGPRPTKTITQVPANTSPSQPAAPATTVTGAGNPAATAPVIADFRALFSPTVTTPTPEPAQKPIPTAEAVFGPNPWLANPTGIAPNGQIYGYNPFYFATAQTAAQVAKMVVGTVVSANVFTSGSTGGFSQQQPNYMVKLPDDRLINPGLVASFYTHGYPQQFIDTMVANEIRNT